MPGVALSLVDTVEGIVYPAFVMLAGLGVVLYSYHRHRQRQLIRDTATSDVESMAVGAVELRGTVDPATDAGTVTAPLTDEDCTVVDYEVEEYRWSDDGKEWVTQDGGVVARPFYLDDGTGRVLVDPTEWSSQYDISEENRRRERYDDTADQPPSVDDFLEAHTDESPDSDRKRRYTQAVIPVGAEAYVFGDAEMAADVSPGVAPDSDLVVTDDEDAEMFLVSDKAEDQLVEDRRYSLVLGGLAGIGIFSVGLWWFLATLGV